MQKCRKLEEYAIFIGKIREYTKKNYTIEKAIDMAVDECIKEGILETILRENREEVCSMLLTEYDEQAHIESEREIAKEEGREEGRERVNQLNSLLIENNRVEDLLKAATDTDFQTKLFDEFGI